MRRTQALAPLPLLAALSLAACDDAASAKRFAQRQAELDPPRLWKMQDPDGASRICADSIILVGFSRAQLEVSGAPCVPEGHPVSKAGVYALRCRGPAGGFAISAASWGDPRRDFFVRYQVAPLQGQAGQGAKTVRYTLLGPCPAGWRIGDRAQG